MLDFIQTHLRSSTGDIVMPRISHLWDSGVVWIVLTLVVLSYPKARKTGAAFAAAPALYFSRSTPRFPALVLAALIGFSRLYCYVRCPTDVLAGAMLGVLLGWAGCAPVCLVERRFCHRDRSPLFGN